MKSRIGAAIVVLPETFDFECLHVATALENCALFDVEKNRCRSVDASLLRWSPSMEGAT